MKCFALSSISLLLLSTMAWAGIEVPEQVELGSQLVATVDATVPEGATFDGGWSIEGPGRVTWLPLEEKGKIGIWATPGKYTIRYSGFWLLLKEVKFKDGDGNEVVIQSYLGHGTVNEQAQVEVIGGSPEPDPGPTPPNPGGKYQIMFFIETEDLDNLPNDQRNLVASLDVRTTLDSMGHVFLAVLDIDSVKDRSDSWGPWMRAAKGQTLPILLMRPIDGGEITVQPLPPDFGALLKALGEDVS